MDNNKFNEIVEAGMEWSREVLTQKAGVYQHGSDRLSGFKTAGRIDAVTPERALWGMALKHRVKLEDIITNIGLTGVLPTRGQLRETTGDLRNYLHLLEALILERIVTDGQEQLPQVEKSLFKTPQVESSSHEAIHRGIEVAYNDAYKRLHGVGA